MLTLSAADRRLNSLRSENDHLELLLSQERDPKNYHRLLTQQVRCLRETIALTKRLIAESDRRSDLLFAEVFRILMTEN